MLKNANFPSSMNSSASVLFVPVNYRKRTHRGMMLKQCDFLNQEGRFRGKCVFVKYQGGSVFV